MGRWIALGVLLAVSAFTVQGCSDLSRQSSEPAYGNAYDYATYGYGDPYANPYASWPYDPLIYSYWYPPPVFYYRYAGDNDHDCDDGYCGSHRRHKPQPILPRPLAAPRPLTATRGAVGVRTAGAGGNGGFHSGGASFGGHASHH